MRRPLAALIAAAALAGGGCGGGSDTSSYTGFPEDLGPKAHREEIMERFEQLAAAVEEGDPVAVCASLTHDGSASRPGRMKIGGTRRGCERRVAYVIDAVARGDIRWPAHRFVWVRSYGGVGGVTVAGPGGQRSRMQFVRHPHDGWEADIYDLYELRLLNASGRDGDAP